MNSTWRGLRPTVGLRRPGGCLLRRRRPTLGAQRPERPISIGGRAFGRWSACADREGVFCVGGGRRLARSARRGRFQSAGGPSADGRPVRRMNSAFEGLRPSVGLERRMNSTWRGLRPTVGLRRPGRCLLRRRRPTLGAQRPERPISIGVRAFGRWSACADRGGVLRRRRPMPGAERLRRPISIGGRAFGRRLACADREGVFCVGGGRRLARSAWEGRFQSA
jgi:hypothetical protein